VQAHNDLDGSVGPLLAQYLDMPYVGYVAGLKVEGDKVIARKEYSGGLIAEVEVKLPAVLGIQASETPPRYVAYSKIRQVMGTAKIDEQAAEGLDTDSGVVVSRMFQPESAERATMLEGSPEDVSDKLIGIFREMGTL
jgi:electron transfer flavoprotein beta subunit